MAPNNRWVRSEARGFKGGVWVLWKEDEVGMKLEVGDRFFVHFRVKLLGGCEWELTAVYASPNYCVRKFLWGKLYEIVATRPWALVGDFIYTLLGEERCSGTGVSVDIQIFL